MFHGNVNLVMVMQFEPSHMADVNPLDSRFQILEIQIWPRQCQGRGQWSVGGLHIEFDESGQKLRMKKRWMHTSQVTLAVLADHSASTEVES